MATTTENNNSNRKGYSKIEKAALFGVAPSLGVLMALRLVLHDNSSAVIIDDLLYGVSGIGAVIGAVMWRTYFAIRKKRNESRRAA